MSLTYMQAFDLLKEYANKPVFAVKIGICSPEVEWVDFETALDEFSKIFPNWGDVLLMEYVYVYVPWALKDAEKINQALDMFGLGIRRNPLREKYIDLHHQRSDD